MTRTSILDPGEHQYRIVSMTTDVFEPGARGETLWWWDIVGSGWQMRMDDVTVQVQLPAEPLRAPDCVMGENTPCTATVDGRSMTVDIPGGLDAFTPVTVRLAFDSSAISANDGPGRWPVVILTILLSILAAVLCVVLYRRTRERAPGMPVLFEPPEGVGPALGVRVLREQRSPDDLKATLFDLGERGVLKLSGSRAGVGHRSAAARRRVVDQPGRAVHAHAPRPRRGRGSFHGGPRRDVGPEDR